MSHGAARGNGRPGEGARPDKSVYWILAGLVVTGIAAIWNWARKLPRLPK